MGTMSTTSAIAVSGMHVAELRLQVSAANIANALSDGPSPGSTAASRYPTPYVPRRVYQTATAGGATYGRIDTESPGYLPKFDPTAPYAYDNGMVAHPNVGLTREIVQQIMARFSFVANAQVQHADARMTAKLLDVIV
jgi:flagellar basal-body rod protein FlgC